MTPSTCLAMASTRLDLLGGVLVGVGEEDRVVGLACACLHPLDARVGKKGLDRSGTITPRLPVRPVISPRAARLGR